VADLEALGVAAFHLPSDDAVFAAELATPSKAKTLFLLLTDGVFADTTVLSTLAAATANSLPVKLMHETSPTYGMIVDDINRPNLYAIRD